MSANSRRSVQSSQRANPSQAKQNKTETNLILSRLFTYLSVNHHVLLCLYGSDLFFFVMLLLLLLCQNGTAQVVSGKGTDKVKFVNTSVLCKICFILCIQWLFGRSIGLAEIWRIPQNILWTRNEINQRMHEWCFNCFMDRPLCTNFMRCAGTFCTVCKKLNASICLVFFFFFLNSLLLSSHSSLWILFLALLRNETYSMNCRRTIFNTMKLAFHEKEWIEIVWSVQWGEELKRWTEGATNKK